MRILIAGASGLIGSALVKQLRTQHDTTLLGRDRQRLAQQFNHSLPSLSWDELNSEIVSQFDIVINLAGANVGAKRWSDSYKREIINSRVKTTARLAELCAELGSQAPRLFNASAIGIYGLQSSQAAQQQTVYTESSDTAKPATDFLAEVGQAWEQALQPALAAGVNVVTLRFGVVLSREGGALAKMLPSFKLGGGAIIGSGEQPMSWISLIDVVNAIEFLINRSESAGAYNLVAPEIVTQAQFARTLAQQLHRPCWLRMPTMVVKAMFGQMGEELLLNGQAVKAERLTALGFVCQHADLAVTLNTILE